MNLPTTTRACPCCQRLRDDVQSRRRNTAYVDEPLNWLDSCGACYQQDYEYYTDLWQEYYAGCM